MIHRMCFAAIMAVGVFSSAQAQTIYPINRAEILASSEFDFKVEFPDAPQTLGAVSVTINGVDARQMLGADASFIPNEDGQNYAAFWIKKAQLAKPGRYIVEARSGNRVSQVAWDVYGTPKKAKAKNVILFVGDGMTIANRTAARILSKGLVEGRFGGELAMDTMPYTALVSTAGTDSVVTDSANSMSAYTTGHKSCVNALGVYCSRSKGTLDHPKVETLTELIKRKTKKSVGIVTNAEIEDATPAGMFAHTRRRSDFNDIVAMMYAVQPDVLFGGGSPNFLPKSIAGSKRADDVNYIERFKSAGYAFVTNAADMKVAASRNEKKMLGLFNTGNVDGAYDLKFKKGTTDRFPDQPDLVAQTQAALTVLSRNQNGFVLMVESGRIDKYSHSLDWERSVYDTIMLDNAVKVAMDFAGKRNDTLIIVVPDHAHAMSIAGTFDDTLPGTTPREKLGTYDKAKFPAYVPDAQGYPERVDLPQRLAVLYGTFPDHCFSGKPYVDGEFVPAVPGPEKGTYVANEKYCVPGAVKVTGNIPNTAPQGVHTGDDVILVATGPGADAFKGRIDNTRVFRIMAEALALGRQ